MPPNFSLNSTAVCAILQETFVNYSGGIYNAEVLVNGVPTVLVRFVPEKLLPRDPDGSPVAVYAEIAPIGMQ